MLDWLARLQVPVADSNTDLWYRHGLTGKNYDKEFRPNQVKQRSEELYHDNLFIFSRVLTTTLGY